MIDDSPLSYHEKILKRLDEREELSAMTAAAMRDLMQTAKLYFELIYEVATVHPGESRHDTAKRYIHERENRPSDGPAQASDGGNET